MPEWKSIKEELPELEHFCLLYNDKEEKYVNVSNKRISEEQDIQKGQIYEMDKSF